MQGYLTIAGACCATAVSAAMAVGQAAQARAVPRAEPAAQASHEVRTTVAELTKAADGHRLAFPTARQFVHVHSVSSVGLVFSRDPKDPSKPPEELYPAATQAFVHWSQETSTSPERRGRTRTAGPVSVEFIGEQGREAWMHIGSPKLTGYAPRSRSTAPAGYELGDSRLTRAKLLAVSRDPAAVYRRYLSRAGPAPEYFAQVGAELATVGFPRRLRVTVMRALALFPGVHVVDGPIDGIPHGDIGLQDVAEPSDERSAELIFDTATGRVTEVEQRSRFGFAFLEGPVLPIQYATTYLQRTVSGASGVS